MERQTETVDRTDEHNRTSPAQNEAEEPPAGISSTANDELSSQDPLALGQPSIGRSTHGTGASGGSTSGAGARASRRPGGY